MIRTLVLDCSHFWAMMRSIINKGGKLRASSNRIVTGIACELSDHGRKSFGHVTTLDDAQARFKARPRAAPERPSPRAPPIPFHGDERR